MFQANEARVFRASSVETSAPTLPLGIVPSGLARHRARRVDGIAHAHLRSYSWQRVLAPSEVEVKLLDSLFDRQFAHLNNPVGSSRKLTP